MNCKFIHNGKEYTESELKELYSDYMSSPTVINTKWENIVSSKKQTLGRRQKELNDIRFQISNEKNTAKRKELQIFAKQKEDAIKKIEEQLHGFNNSKTIDYVFNVMYKSDIETLNTYISMIRKNPKAFTEIQEAENIIKFYRAIGSIDENNPIFERDALVKLSPENINILTSMAAGVSKYSLDLETLLQERLVNHINSNKDIQQKLGKKFTYAELVEAIPDIDKFTRDFLNVSKTGIVSGEQSILAELMFYHMAKTNEEATSEIKDKTSKLDALTQEAIKELNSLGYTGSKTFDIFFEKVNGKETGNLISQVSNKFYSDRNAVTKRHWRAIKSMWKTYYTNKDKTVRKQVLSDITEAQKGIDAWYRENAVTFDIRKLDDLWDLMDPEMQNKFAKFRQPNDENHKQEIISLVGEKMYRQMLKQQIEQLEEYIAAEETSFANIENNPNIQNVDEVKNYYVFRNNPFHGIKERIDATPIMDGNNQIFGSQGQNYLLFVPKDKNEYYDENYRRISANSTLNKFYENVFTLLQTLNAMLPPDVKQGPMQLPLFKQEFSELLLDKNLSAMTTDMWNSIIDVLSDKENLATSVDMKDPVTGKTDLKYNYSGLGLNERNKLVGKREKLLYADFVAKNEREPTAQEFSDLLEQAKDDVAKKSSHDLGKILKLFTAYVVMAEHKERVIPTLSVLQKEYSKVKAAETTNIFGIIKKNDFGEAEKFGERENANKQMAHQLDFFLNRPTNLIEMPLSKKAVLNATDKQEKSEIDSVIQKMNIPEKYKKMDSTALAAEVVEVDIAMRSTTDVDEINELKKLLLLLTNASVLRLEEEKLGGYITGSGVTDAGLRWIQLKSMGWNVPAQMGNLLAGLWSNLITASDGRYFSMSDYMYGLRQMFFSSLKFLTFNKVVAGTADKTKSIMDRLDILQVPTSELFKASVGNVSGKFQKLTPYHIVQRTEYFNQSPLVIARLRNTFITDKNGNKSSVWNALDESGNLLEDFKTDENMQWETGIGDDITQFKLAMEDIIRQTHGDYSNLSRMRVKKYALGRAATQFKTWLPEAINSRFGNERTSLLTGVTTKGRYRSYSSGGAAIFGAAIGTIIMPGIGSGIGFALGKYLGKNETDMSFGQDLVFNAKQLVRKLMFQKTNFDEKFSEVDAAMLRQNMQELQILLMLFTSYILAKLFLFDDDDEKDSMRRIAHNVIVNNLLRQSADLELFSNPFQMSNFAQNAVPMLKLLDDTANLFNATGKLVIGEDEYEAGPYSGESRFKHKIAKFVPTLFSLQLIPDWQKTRVLDEPLISEAFEDE